jgi:hypothetical protein
MPFITNEGLKQLYNYKYVSGGSRQQNQSFLGVVGEATSHGTSIAT